MNGPSVPPCSPVVAIRASGEPLLLIVILNIIKGQA